MSPAAAPRWIKRVSFQRPAIVRSWSSSLQSCCERRRGKCRAWWGWSPCLGTRKRRAWSVRTRRTASRTSGWIRRKRRRSRWTPPASQPRTCNMQGACVRARLQISPEFLLPRAMTVNAKTYQQTSRVLPRHSSAEKRPERNRRKSACQFS